ncbi:MAG TPA: DUF4214 domain-containing protein [Devosia sp.]|nr:DUF4214 domain-containing protein [Devosia sp.]
MDYIGKGEPPSVETAEAFVRAAYAGVLRRAPDENAFAYYVDQLANGVMTYDQLLSYFCSLDEFFARAAPQSSGNAIAALYSKGRWEHGNPYRWVDEPASIVAFHFPKTAGISLRRLIASYLHPLQLGSDAGEKRSSESRYGKYQKFFCWHMTWAEYCTIPGPKVTLSCLREPKSRLLSLFGFLRAIHDTAGVPYDAAAKAAFHSPQEFFEPRNPAVRNVVDNAYVRTLAEAECRDGEPDPLWAQPAECVDLAFDRIKRFDGLFALEEVSESGGKLPERVRSVLSKALGTEVSQMMPRANIGPGMDVPVALAEEQVLELTRLDAELYRRVLEHIGKAR